jgi:hypothetical protein
VSIAQTQLDHDTLSSRRLLFPEYLPISPLVKKQSNTTIDISSSLPNHIYRFYDAKSYYTRGMFGAMPFNEWGPYQVPFHLANEKIVVIKKKR